MKATTNSPLQLLYKPSENKKMEVVVFGSGSGSNLEALLEAENRGAHFSTKAIVTDRNCRCNDIAKSRQIPLLYLSYVRFMKEHQGEDSKESLREKYEALLVSKLSYLAREEEFSIDFIFLAGYMRLVTPVLLESFPKRVLNIHPADLTSINPKGNRQYVGKNAVSLALQSGEKRTRSCVILVDEGVDTGTIISSGPWVSYSGNYPPSEKEKEAHQEKQKIMSDWPVAVQTLEYISQGKVAITTNKAILFEGCQQGPSGITIQKEVLGCVD